MAARGCSRGRPDAWRAPAITPCLASKCSPRLASPHIGNARLRPAPRTLLSPDVAVKTACPQVHLSAANRLEPRCSQPGLLTQQHGSADGAPSSAHGQGTHGGMERRSEGQAERDEREKENKRERGRRKEASQQAREIKIKRGERDSEREKPEGGKRELTREGGREGRREGEEEEERERGREGVAKREPLLARRARAIGALTRCVCCSLLPSLHLGMDPGYMIYVSRSCACGNLAPFCEICADLREVSHRFCTPIGSPARKSCKNRLEIFYLIPPPMPPSLPPSLPP